MATTTGNSCTDTATMKRRRKTATGMHDKHQTIEEPCEGKLSRTVLKGGPERATAHAYPVRLQAAQH